MTTLQDITTLAPLWIIAIAACVVLLLTVAGGFRRASSANGAHLAIICLGALATSAWLLWQHEGSAEIFSGAILVDGLGVVFGITVVVGTALGILISTCYLHEHGLSYGEYYALMLLSAVGMMTLAMAGDLITLFIGIETMSLGVYVLAGYRRSSRRSQEAALKYFVYGAFASAFVLFGIALLYGEVGRITGEPGLAFKELGRAFATNEVGDLGWIAVALVFAGLGFKIAVVPFHMWAPDVYEGAPTPSAGFMAVGVKAAAFAGLCRFVSATFMAATTTENMVQALEILALLTMLVGNLLAIRQTQIKRMLAYSSIAHAGYALVGVVAFVANRDSDALVGLAYYLFGYTAMTLGAFGIVLAFERREDRRLDVAIDRLAGVAHRYPALGLAMALFMFSLAGMPPTAGFFGKLALFGEALEAGRVGLVILAVLASAMGAYYYLRVMVVMYMQVPAGEERRVRSPWLAAGLWACAALTLVVGVVPDTYLGFARRALAGWLS